MIYGYTELIQMRPCKILIGPRSKNRWRTGAFILLKTDNYCSADGKNHLVVKYQGKYLLLGAEQVKEV